MSSVGQYLSKIPLSIKLSKEFSCSQCPHKPGDPWPPQVKAQKPVKPNSDISNIKNELVCYYSRAHFDEPSCVLGVGIHATYFSSGGIKSLSSPLEYLSWQAFDEQHVRTSAHNTSEFSFWLPLYLNLTHFAKASTQNLFEQAICKITKAPYSAFRPELAVAVLTKLMKTMVVNFMNESLHVSVKSLQGFCHFQRLLIMVVKKHPAVLEQINRQISAFAANEKERRKDVQTLSLKTY